MSAQPTPQDEPQDEPQPAPAESTYRRGRLFPPVWVGIPIIVCVLLIVWIRNSEVAGDHAVVNLLTLIITFLASVALAFWFFLLSGYSRWFRLSVFAAGLLSTIGFFSLFKGASILVDQVAFPEGHQSKGGLFRNADNDT